MQHQLLHNLQQYQQQQKKLLLLQLLLLQRVRWPLKA